MCYVYSFRWAGNILNYHTLLAGGRWKLRVLVSRYRISFRLLISQKSLLISPRSPDKLKMTLLFRHHTFHTKRSGVQTFKVLERGCLSERHTIAKSGLHINSMAGIHNLTCDSNPQPCNNMNAIDLQSDVEDRQSVVGMVSAFIGVKISVTKMILISILICLIGCIACCCMLLIGYCTGDDYNKLPREMR